MLDEMRVHGARLRKAHGELHHSRRAYGVRVHPLDGGCTSLRVLCRLNDVLISTYARPTEMPATMVWYTAKMPRGLRCG